MRDLAITQSIQNGMLSIRGTQFTTLALTEFGLSEKDARLYIHLLKYGPKRAGDLARSLKTYRLDVYRKLATLITKNLVSMKKESPAVYTAMPLENALNNLVLAREGELRLMEKRSAELLARMNGTQATAHSDIQLQETFLSNGDLALTQYLSALPIDEKDARLYIHLLKYGPKRAGDLARSLKTYREDIYRRCARLNKIGMVTKTSEDVTRYVPVGIDVALANALTTHTRELHRLQQMKQRFIKDARVTQWRSEQTSRFKLINTFGEVATAISQIINMSKFSIILASPPQFNLISMGGFQNHLKYAVARGVDVRGVLDIKPRITSMANAYINCGVELRHLDHYRGVMMVVADGKQSVSLIHADLKSGLSLDERVAALWGDSATQAIFLTSAFEILWERAINAKKHLNHEPREESHHDAHGHLERNLPAIGC